MMSARIKNLVKVAILVAVLAAGSQISIPTPFLVPITLQILFVALVGFLLKTPSALATIFTYVSIGAVGLPVFAGFRGGFGSLFDATGGFITGFVFSGLAYWLSTKALKNNKYSKEISLLISLLVCYIF